MADPYELERQRIEAQKAAKQAELLSALNGAQQAPQLGTTQAIAQGVLGILPMVLGYAMAKKRGLLAGAQAGQAASKEYEEREILPAKLSQANSAARAKALQSEISALNKSDTSIGLAAANADATMGRVGAQFENQKELEGVKQQNRLALQQADKQVDPEIEPYLSRIVNGEDVDVPPEIAQKIISSGYLDEVQRAQSQKIAKNAINQKKEQQQAQYEVPGLQRVIDRNGKPMSVTKDDYKLASNWTRTLPKANMLLDKIESALKTGDSALFFANKNSLIETIKELRNYGAAFSGYEMSLVESQLGTIQDLKQFKEYMIQQSRSGNATALFKNFRNNLQKDFVSNIIAAKQIPSGWKQVVEPDGVHFYQETPQGLVEIPYQSLINSAASGVR